MIFFGVALIILLASSLPWVAIARIPNKPAWFMALYLVGNANVVLSSYVTNSLHLLDQGWAMLVMHILIGGLGWVLWWQAGKPLPWEPFQKWIESLEKGSSRQWLRREPALVTLGGIMTICYLFAMLQIIVIPQNNMDSLSTHLSRIAFWRQHGSFFPWPTFSTNQISYPVNAQLQTYWTLLFLGTDRLVGAAQWLATVTASVGVLGMARLLGYRFRQAGFAALLFLSFPLVILQATTTQTDLVTATFFLLTIYFLLLGLKQGDYRWLVLAAIGVGVGIGIKKSYFLLLPIICVTGLLATLQFGRHSLKRLAIWAFYSIICTSALGLYVYVTNWQSFGYLFGVPVSAYTLLEIPESQGEPYNIDPQLLAPSSEELPAQAGTRNSLQIPRFILVFAHNAPRLVYQALDTSGLPWPLDGYAHKIKQRIVFAFWGWIGFEDIEGTAFTAPGHNFSFSDKNINEENHAWYGPLSVLLLFPAIICEFLRGLRTRCYIKLAPGLALLMFLPMEIALRPGWDSYQGRYFAPIIALCAPLMGFWFKPERRKLSEWFILGMAVLISVNTLLYNPSKPTLGKYAGEFHVWSNDRIFVQTIQRKRERKMYYLVEKNVPADATIGYYIPFYIMDYPLFGENLNRRLKPIVQRQQVSDGEWLHSQGIEYLLLPNRDDYPKPPPDYQLKAETQGWRIYVPAIVP